MSYLEEGAPRVRIDDFRREEDLRERREGYNDKTKDMYDAMLTLILDHKKELQKIPAASSLKSAQIWARKRGLRAGEEDFNGDGIPETVVYNKAGQPFIINGYKLKASDYGIRNRFFNQFPTPEARVGESMKNWSQQMSYDVQDDPDNPWRKHIKKKRFARELEEAGWKLPTKPKKKLSVFNIFCKLIAPILKAYYEAPEEYYKTFLMNNAGANCVKILKKIVSPITMYRMLYMKMVEREYFFALHASDKRFDNMSYAQFKQFIKNNDNSFYRWFKTNYLSTDQTQFKQNKVTPLVIQGQIVKDEINWDGSDKDDAIVFMVGIANMQDGECATYITNDEAAADFLNRLSDKHNSQHKSAMKALMKWKKVASESQKNFFKDQVQYLFENDGAYDRFLGAVENGRNSLANTTPQAREEAEEHPTSPLRPPEPAPETTQEQYDSDNAQEDEGEADDEGDN